jgi:hypothetical protein
MKKKLAYVGILSLFLLSINSAYASSDPASTTVQSSTKYIDVSTMATTQSNTSAKTNVQSSTTLLSSQPLLKNNSLSVSPSPNSTSKPTTYTNLPYTGSFSGVSNSEIYSNNIFSTTGHTDFYVDWSVTCDDPGCSADFVIKLYNASGTLVLTSATFNTTSNPGTWSTHFTGLSSSQNYYISFKYTWGNFATSISGDFTAHY